MAEAKDMVPDKETYQVNRRRMSWVVLVMMACMTVAIIGWTERYENANVMEMAYLALSGLVAAYFGATAFQSVKRTVKKK